MDVIETLHTLARRYCHESSPILAWDASQYADPAREISDAARFSALVYAQEQRQAFPPVSDEEYILADFFASVLTSIEKTLPSDFPTSETIQQFFSQTIQ